MIPIDTPSEATPVSNAAEMPGRAVRPATMQSPLPSRRRRDAIGHLLLIAAIDIISLTCGFALSSLLRFGVVNHPMVGEILPLLCVLFLTTAIITGAYAPTALHRLRSFVLSGVRSMIIALLLLFAVLFLMKIGIEFSRILISSLFITAVVGLSIGRLFSSYVLLKSSDTGVTRTLEIHASANEREGLHSENATTVNAADVHIHPDPTDHENVTRLVAATRGYDRVIVTCAVEARSAWADMLRCLDVQAELRLPELDPLKPTALSQDRGRVSVVVMDHPLEWNQALLKRLFDLGITLSLMPILLPMMAIVALAIRLESRGPVFFLQERIGLGNRTFRMIKFRSMRRDVLDYKASTLTDRNDPRVTKVGAFIRKTSIDEIPQFINVIMGDMSIVGPRPHAYSAKAGDLLYWEVDNNYWHRHIAKPGITGLAQVRGFRGNTFEEKDLQDRLDADLEYVANWSLLRDFEILFATLRVIRHDRAF
jgi:exopolysaccharide biosynthesis polyprenyl glycosylphosphotransferase